ncbi:MAG: gamma carbonic anhydrase family protein [Chloroflexi bacterium]|nr:gamma carbonic anhydrase family protein [Chloroflexota bacterium]
MPILPYLDKIPTVGSDVRLAADAFIVGRASVEGPAVLESSAVLRADQNGITVGSHFHIGQGSTVHVERHTDTRIGAYVWVGDNAVVHATTVGDGTRVEDGGLVLSTSKVGAGSIVAADALVSEGAEFPENSYISGTPGRRIRDTTPEERAETLAMIRAAFGGLTHSQD